jgi:antibiotic biosynthesis monooxygenase (ABM) superfamily enzyme
MGGSNNIENGPVTMIWNWSVKPNKEALFEQMMHDIHKVARTFPGHMGVTNLKSPTQKGKFQTILRFDNTQHLEAWLNSDIRNKMAGLLSEVAKVDTSSKATGLETWFDAPGQHVTPPPRWKMATTTFVAIYPLSLIYGYLVVPRTISWPVAARALILPIFAPIILTYLFMPFLTQRVLKRWLYRDAQ